MAAVAGDEEQPAPLPPAFGTWESFANPRKVGKDGNPARGSSEHALIVGLRTALFEARNEVNAKRDKLLKVPGSFLGDWKNKQNKGEGRHPPTKLTNLLKLSAKYVFAEPPARVPVCAIPGPLLSLVLNLPSPALCACALAGTRRTSPWPSRRDSRRNASSRRCQGPRRILC